MLNFHAVCFVVALSLAAPLTIAAQPTRTLQPSDVWDIEYVRNPAVSPDGRQVAYERVGFDIMTDRSTSDIYLVGFDGSRNRPLITEASSPRWSPDGKKVAFVRAVDDKPQVFVRYLDGGEELQVTKVQEAPGGMTWSPDGTQLAFVMPVAYEASKSVVQLPPKPAGAKWAGDPIYIDRLKYRADGGGYLKPRYDQLFVVGADGGTARQLTFGDYDHAGPTFTPDGKALLFSADASADEREVGDTNLGRVTTDGRGAVTWLTTRKGPDDSPKVSPSGKLIAYAGFDDRRLGYHNTELYVANLDGSNARSVTAGARPLRGRLPVDREGRAHHPVRHRGRHLPGAREGLRRGAAYAHQARRRAEPRAALQRRTVLGRAR